MRRRAGRTALAAGLSALLLLAGGLAAASVADTNFPSNGRSPQVNYMLECQGCHLPEGRGMPGAVPVMKGFIHRFLDVEGGREYLVKVPGVANSKLGDADIAALLNWSIETMGPVPRDGFRPYTTEEVARYRALRLTDVPGTRAALIDKMSGE